MSGQDYFRTFSVFLTSCFVWGMGEFFKAFFYLSEVFMALKESYVGDQFSKELQLMHNLKFMHSFSVLLNTYCPILCNMVYEFQVSLPKLHCIETRAEASLCTIQFEFFSSNGLCLETDLRML